MENSRDQQLVTKYFEGKCTHEESALVEAWLWDDYQEGSETMPDEVVLSLEEKLKEQILRSEPAPVIRMQRKKYFMIAAAILLVILASGALLLQLHRTQTKDVASTGAYRDSIYNKGERPYKVALPDGSTVWLNAGSTLFIASDFNQNSRRVKIIGEAFFNIRRDTASPFYTTAGNLTTHVLGTSYDVEAWPSEKEIRVSLLHGKVAVHSVDSACTLSPGQILVYQRKEGRMRVGNFTVKDPAGWISGKIVLNRITLPEALDRLSRIYHTPLQYDARTIGDMYITGEFDRDSLPVVLKSILFVHNLKISGTANGGYKIY